MSVMVKASFGGPLRKLLSKTNSPVLVVWVVKQTHLQLRLT